VNCVYTVIHTKTKKFYFGSTTDFKRRKRQHLAQLRKGVHDNSNLQDLYNDDPNLEWETMFVEHIQNARYLENTFIQAHSGNPYLINQLGNGCQITDDGLARISKANTGRVKSLETRAQMSASHMGLGHTEETRAKMSATRKGRKFSPEHKAKLGKHNCRRMSIDGVEYRSGSDAAKAVGLSVQSTLDRCRSDKWPNWFIL